MDYIRPIGPVERDIDPVYRVERTGDEREEREQEPRKRQTPAEKQTETQTQEDVGPVEGEDGHLHIDVKA
jgi:hypothetical protein